MARTGSVQGELWGARARDWAEVQEGQARPLYDAALGATGIGPGTALLDVGCGAGMFAAMARAAGAQVSGLDAAAALLEIARERSPDASFVQGDVEELPYPDGSFDVVTAFNSIQFAADPPQALREAVRVARPRGLVLIATWGRPDQCEAAAYLEATRELMPPPPPGAEGPFALSAAGRLEDLVGSAGLSPKEVTEVECTWVYEDEATALRGLLSAGPVALAIRHSGARRVEAATRAVVGRFRTSDGYRMRNVFRYVLAKTP